jgi:uncharacterized protein
MRKQTANKISRHRRFRWALGYAPLIAVTDAFALEPAWIKVRTLRLTTNTLRRRVVQFTDLHHKGDRALLQSVVKTINRLSPGFVCFTGDIVEDGRFLPEAVQLIQGIKSPLYGVLGNQDYWDLDLWRDASKAHIRSDL